MSDAALAKLGRLLSRPEFRKAFANNHVAAMEQKGLKPQDIPKGVLNTLASLSEEELEVLGTVKGALRRSRVPTRIIAEMV